MNAPPGSDQFQRFLAVLGPDAASAGEQYELLRERLIRFFTWERCPDPDQWTDTVLNRVAVRIGAGQEIRNVPAFTSAVARIVLLEARRFHGRETTLDQVGALPAPESAPPNEAVTALEECLKRLPPATRDLILRYYQGDAQARIHNRQMLAKEMDISVNSLRNQALRIRDTLEQCVSKRLKRDTSAISGTKGRSHLE